MTHFFRYRCKAAVGYLDSPEDSFGRGDNLMLEFSFVIEPDADERVFSRLRATCQFVVQQLDHKHLHLESPEWRDAGESMSYGMDRILQVILYHLRARDRDWKSLSRVDLISGAGALRSFEKKAKLFA